MRVPVCLLSACLVVLVAGTDVPAQEVAPPAAPAWFTESFEGTPPKGWGKMWGAWGEGLTTDEAGAPPGGGKYAFRQMWPEGQGAGGLGLSFARVPGMPAKLGTGSEFVMRYFLKYDADFDFGPTTGFKQIIVQSDSLIHDRLYICILGRAGNIGVIFQTTRDTTWLHANTGNGACTMPRGRWVEFVWYVRVSPESEKKGILRGWVDGKLRWNYENIATIQSGSYVSLTLNPTFNQAVRGPNQKRYWDLFAMGPATVPAEPK
ncbi:MAG TPA: hypothetical protein VMY39_10790 [Planctomycetota bacterium]|nr:hypothetical protein [Planctomycetota bacterium]